MIQRTCGFNEAWTKTCKAIAPCEKHKGLECVSCKAPATHSCDETGQFACGAPLCDECEHAIAPDGTNGGIGFYSTIPDYLQKDWKSHVKETEQKFKPYWQRGEMREESLDALEEDYQ